MSVLHAELSVPAAIHRDYLLALADRAMVLGQQLCGLVTHLPDFDEDLAISNIALDLVGQARALYTHAAEIEDEGRSEDDMAFLRDADEFFSPLLVERGDRDFANVIARQFLHDRYATLQWDALQSSSDPVLAGIAAKAVKETRYHCRYGTEWVVRLGDGTQLSHDKMQSALEAYWPYVAELFERASVDPLLIEVGIAIDPAKLKAAFFADVDKVLAEATLSRPVGDGGPVPVAPENHARRVALLSVMQAEYRAHPGAEW